MKNKIISYLSLGLALGILAAPAQAKLTQQTDLYVVMFRADWCPPCKVVEPRLDQALNRLSDNTIEYVQIDITDSPRIEISAHKAFDREIVPQYNKWYGATGFAAIIDADTKKTLGCVTMQYSTQDMMAHIRNLKTYADANSPITDFTCPDANHALPSR